MQKLHFYSTFLCTYRIGTCLFYVEACCCRTNFTKGHTNLHPVGYEWLGVAFSESDKMCRLCVYGCVCVCTAESLQRQRNNTKTEVCQIELRWRNYHLKLTLSSGSNQPVNVWLSTINANIYYFTHLLYFFQIYLNQTFCNSV